MIRHLVDAHRSRRRRLIAAAATVVVLCALTTVALLGLQAQRADRSIPVTHARTTPAGGIDPAAVDRFMVDNLRATGLPGATLALISDHRVVTVSGYGTGADGSELTASTPMAIGSVSKAMTATAVMQLVQAGRVDLDRPAQHYLPNFTTRHGSPEQITVRQLLNQTSGLADSGFPEMSLHQPTSTAQEIVRLRQADLVARPGAEWNYTNPNYHILARLIEVVSGEPFDTYLSRHVFGPAGMPHSRTVTSPADPSSGLTDGAVDAAGLPVFVPALDHFVAGSGGVISTASDMASWLQVQLRAGQGANGRVLSRNSLQQMQTSDITDPAYGFGWFINDRPPLGPAITHGGTLFTYSSDVAVFPDLGDGYAIMFNDVTPSGAEQASFSAGLAMLLAGQQPTLGTPVAQILGIIVANLIIIATAFGVRGVIGSRSWARRRHQQSGIGTAVRLGWLLIPIAAALSVPRIVGVLFGGRDITWTTAWYGWGTLVVLLGMIIIGCLATATCRTIALLSPSAKARNRSRTKDSGSAELATAR